MKKILSVTVLIFCVFIISSCDYPENHEKLCEEIKFQKK